MIKRLFMNRVFAFGFGIIILAAVILMTQWSTLSDPVAVHFGDGGEADAWASKSVKSVFYFVFLAFVIWIVLYFISRMLIIFTPSDFSDQKKAMILGASQGLSWVALFLVITNVLLAFSAVFESWSGVAPIGTMGVTVLSMLSPVLVLIFVVVGMDKPVKK